MMRRQQRLELGAPIVGDGSNPQLGTIRTSGRSDEEVKAFLILKCFFFNF